MKKLLSILFIVCMVFSVVSVQADAIGDGTLGTPLMNIDDTAILARYPAALQLFPNSIFARFNNAGNDYEIFGLAYKDSDLLGICFSYENAPTTLTQNLGVGNADMVQIVSFIYGLKLGELLGGFSAKTYFYHNTTANADFGYLNYTDINTNALEYYWDGTYGFKSTFNPSAIIDLGIAKVYATVESTLNFTKYEAVKTNKEVAYMYTKPAMFENLGISALLVKELNDTTIAGLEVKFSMQDKGFSWDIVTNGNSQAETLGLTNDMVGGIMTASLGFGTRIKATENTTLFIDLETSYKKETDVHQKDADKSTYTNRTTWNIPSLNLGAQFELVKNLKLRISANPSYSLTTKKLESYENISADTYFESQLSAFTVNTTLGLGYKIGSFYINWELNSAFLNAVLKNPMSFVNINGTGPVLSTSTVQVNYVF